MEIKTYSIDSSINLNKQINKGIEGVSEIMGYNGKSKFYTSGVLNGNPERAFFVLARTVDWGSFNPYENPNARNVVLNLLQIAGLGYFFRHPLHSDNNNIGSIVAISQGTEQGNIHYACGLLTDVPRQPIYTHLGQYAAVAVYSHKKRVGALLQVSKEAALSNIVGTAVAQLKSDFGATSEDIVASIVCTPELRFSIVPLEQVPTFEHSVPASVLHITAPPGPCYIDMGKLLVQQLLTAGVLNEHIEKILAFCKKRDVVHLQGGVVSHYHINNATHGAVFVLV